MCPKPAQVRRVESGAGARIFRWRVEHAVALCDLARMSGVSRHWLYKVETGQGRLGVEKAEQIAQAIGCTASWLLFGDGQAPDERKSREEAFNGRR